MEEKKNKTIGLAKHGYETYAVLRGNKKLVKLMDSTDVVTDKENNSIPVICTNRKDVINFMPRGRNNNMMYDVMRKVGTNVTVGSNIEHKTKVILGDSVQVYRKKRNEHGKIIKEEVLEDEIPEIFEFMENNDYEQIRMEIADDLAIFNDAYIEYLFDRNEKPRLVQVKSKEATCSRISELDGNSGKSEWHGYSAEWHKGTATDVIATPLLNRQAALFDLKIRMGLLPNDEGEKKTVDDRNFIHNLRINTPGRFYYSRPYWWLLVVAVTNSSKHDFNRCKSATCNFLFRDTKSARDKNGTKPRKNKVKNTLPEISLVEYLCFVCKGTNLSLEKRGEIPISLIHNSFSYHCTPNVVIASDFDLKQHDLRISGVKFCFAPCWTFSKTRTGNRTKDLPPLLSSTWLGNV